MAMRLVVALVVIATLGCGRAESPTTVSQSSDPPAQNGPQSPRNEVAKQIEAGRLFIEAGHFDEAKAVLREAATSPDATASDQALIQALLAKIDSVASSPQLLSGLQDDERPAESSPLHSQAEHVASDLEKAGPALRTESSNGPEVATVPPAASSEEGNDLPALIERVRPSVVVIRTDVALGSGFVVGGGLIATNRHVLEDAKFASVQFSDGAKYAVEGIVYDGGDLDLCIVRCKDLSSGNAKPLPIAAAPPRQGEGVFTFGAPKGLEFSVSQGIVSANRVIDGVEFVQTTAPISQGNSGGPLLSAADGTVVGINTWSRVDGQNLNFAIAASHLTTALSELRSEPLPLSLTNRDRRTSPMDPDGESSPSLLALLFARWQREVGEKRKQLLTEIAETQQALETAQSPGARSAYAVRLAHLLYDRRTLSANTKFDIPKLHLSHVGQLRVGSYGYVQEKMRIFQVLGERSCLVYLDGLVYFLEDYPTKDLTTDVILVANRGPVIYVSGTFHYTNKAGEDRQIFRIRPAWDADKMFAELEERRQQVLVECRMQREQAIEEALMREWTSPTFRGRAMFDTAFGISGKFVAKLKLPDKTEVRVALDELSDEDRKWIADYQRHSQRKSK